MTHVEACFRNWSRMVVWNVLLGLKSSWQLCCSFLLELARGEGDVPAFQCRLVHLDLVTCLHCPCFRCVLQWYVYHSKLGDVLIMIMMVITRLFGHLTAKSVRTCVALYTCLSQQMWFQLTSIMLSTRCNVFKCVLTLEVSNCSAVLQHNRHAHQLVLTPILRSGS